MIDPETPPSKESRAKLYQTLYDKGLYSKSIGEFDTQFSNDSSRAKLYDHLVKEGLYTKTAEDFDNQFFQDLKKKEDSGPFRFPGEVDASKMLETLPPPGSPEQQTTSAPPTDNTIPEEPPVKYAPNALEEALKMAPPRQAPVTDFGNQSVQDIEAGLRQEMDQQAAQQSVPGITLTKQDAFDRPGQLQVRQTPDQLEENKFASKKEHLKNLIREADDAQLAEDMQKYSGKMVESIDQKIEEVRKDAKEKGVWLGGSKNSNIMPNDNEHKQKLEVLGMAKQILEEIKNTNPEDPNGFLKGFFQGMTSKGVGHLIPFVGNISDMPQLAKIRQVAEQVQPIDRINAERAFMGQPPLTEDQIAKVHGTIKEDRTLLTAEALRQQFEEVRKHPDSYRYGQVLGNMLPYIGEYALTAGTYTGVRAAVTVGLETALKGAATKAVVRNGVIKPISSLLATAAQTSLNPQQYVNTTLQRMTPQMKLAMDTDSNELKAIVGDGEEGFTKAFAKAFGTTAMENLTERFGQWSTELGDAMKISGKWMPQVLLGKWMEKRGFVNMAEATKAARQMGWDGIIKEIWFEEYPNKILQNMITGDQKWSPDFFNPLSQEFIDMIPASLIVGGGPLAVGAAGKVTKFINSKLDKTPAQPQAAPVKPKGEGDFSGLEDLTQKLKNEKPKEQTAPAAEPAPVSKTAEETNIPVQANKEEPAVQKEVESFVEKVKAGADLTSPEDQQFYANNKDKIEELLKKSKSEVGQAQGNEVITDFSSEEIQRQIKPHVEKMVDIEKDFEKAGLDIDMDYDDEIQVLNKKGEIVEMEDLPKNLKEKAAQYEEATQVLNKVSGYDEKGKSNVRQVLDQARKDHVKDIPYEEVKAPQLPPATENIDKESDIVKQLTTKGIPIVAAKGTAKSLVKALTDRKTALDLLHTGNKIARDLWTKETGVDLPKTQEGTRQAINDYFDKGSKPTIAEIAKTDFGKEHIIIAKPEPFFKETDVTAMVKQKKPDFEPGNTFEDVTKRFGGKNQFEVIGKNSDGDLVGEDSNGVRAVKKGNIVINQPVGLRPTDKGMQIQVNNPEGEFMTVEEEKAKSEKEQAPIKKSEAKKAHIKKLVSELDELIGPTMGATFDPKAEAERQHKITIKGAEIVGAYIDLGITRFGEIAKEFYQDHGEPALRKFLDALKKGYGSILASAENIDEMDDLKTVRGYTADNLIQSFKPQENDTDRKNADTGSGRSSSQPSPGDAGETQGGTESGEAGGSQAANEQPDTGIQGQETVVSGNGNVATGVPSYSDVGGTRPESVDADVQQNFTYPQNWERNKNKSFSKRQAYADNIAALEVINALLENPTVFATDAQKEILSKYNGLGPLGEILLSDNKGTDWNKTNLEYFDEAQKLKGLLAEIGKKTGTDPIKTAKSSTLSAYYTALPIIRAMWQGVTAGGFTGGRIVEGSVGSGRFIGGMPVNTMNNSRIRGVDMDVVSSLVAKYLYPKMAVSNSPIQQASLPSNAFDLFISNIPFGDTKVYDPIIDKKGGAWKDSQSKLHTYFFAKAIDVVRPGGYVAILTTSNVLDTPGNQSTRDLINRETDFVGAVRLPSSTFNSDAGTQVVTDIILLRKKLNPSETSESQISDIATTKVKHNNPNHPDQDVQYNAYFKNNPSHVFGSEMKAGGLYNAERGYSLEGEVDPVKVGEKLAELAAKMPIQAKKATEEETAQTLQMSPLGRMVSGGIVEQNGKFYRVVDFEASSGKYNTEEIKKTVMPAEKDLPILKDFVDLKNTYFDVLAKDKVGEDASAERKQLKKIAEKFIKTIKPGTMATIGNGSKAIDRLLIQDPDFYAVTSLQKPDGSLSDIIEKPIPRETSELTRTDSPADAIGYSINTFGKINLPFIQKVLGAKTEDQAREIIEPEIFETLDGEIIEKTEYLSGNVREKLAQAEKWAQVSDKFKKNVDELTKVIPQDIPADQITFQFGASWIPLQYTQQFLDTIFGKGNVEVQYTKATDDYKVSSNIVGGEYEATGDGTTRGVDVVVKAALSKYVPDFFRTDSEGNRYPLPNLTQDVRDKAERLQSEFAGLIEADENTQKELTKLYNNFFNGIVQKKNDGSKLTFPGMQGYSLNPHQKDAIMLLIQKMGGMIDHIVGAGKTLVMTVGAIKMKQLGLVNKPMITTMKSVVPGMISEIKRQFPDAKILAPRDNDFSASNRQRLFAQIANNDWDLIIITHENLGTIPLPAEFEEEFSRNEIEELLAALDEINQSSEGKRDQYAIQQAKAIQKKIANAEARIKELQDKGKHASKTDFGAMGIDMLFVDESQQFKNLSFISKLRNVAGLGTAKGSKRAANLKMVSRYLQKMHGGDKGIVFASGTPISNSLVELYNIFQYLRPSILKKLGMVSLDQFLKNFAEITSIMEKNVAGVVKNKTRLTKFVNVPELAGFYSEISDIRGTHNLTLPRPPIRGGKGNIVLTPQSPTVKKITDAIFSASKSKSLGPLRSIGIEPKGDAEKAIGLVLTTIGKKASIDPRLVFPGSKADGGKVATVADKVSDIYKQTGKDKGVQLIFADMGTPKKKNAPLGERVKDQVIEMFGEDYLDEFSRADEVFKQKEETAIKDKLMEVFELSEPDAQLILDEANNINGFNVYEELKRLMIKQGIPADQIAFIHDAPNKKQKEELFKKVNDGTVRVLIGSTQKMGTGVNVQKRVTDMHHLDIGWRPSDLEQRNGRGIRRGNMNADVGIHYYGTEGTIDSYMFDLVAKKQAGIDSFRAGANGVREMDFEDGESMTMSEYAAAISGDTRILDLEKLKAKVNKLRNRVESARRANVLRESRIESSKKHLDNSRESRDNAKEVAETLKKNVQIQELEEEEVTEGKQEKRKIVKKDVAVFIGEVNGQEYNTAIRAERDQFYQRLSDKINSLKSRGSTMRTEVGSIGGIPVYTKGTQGYEKGVPTETGRRIDFGDLNGEATWAPIDLVNSAKLINAASLKSYVIPTIKELDRGVTNAEDVYKRALVNYEEAKNAKEVVAREKDVQELAEATEKKNTLQAELKKEADAQPEPEKESEENTKDNESGENAPKNMSDAIADISKRSGDTFQEFKGAMATGIPLPVVGKVKVQKNDNNLLNYVQQNHLNQQELEKELDRQLEIKDPEVEKRMKDAGEPTKPNMTGGILGPLKDWLSGFRSHFRHLSEKQFPREANILREFEGLKTWANGEANIYIKALIEPLTQRQYKILSRRIILADLLESVKKGLNMAGTDGKLPFGFTDEMQLQRELDKYDDFMQADPKILKAYEARQDFMETFKNNLIAEGLLQENDIQDYYHRRVLAYQTDELTKSILFGKTIGDKKRDFQRKRTGTRGMDYSTNFIETEFKVVAEGMFELEKQKQLKDLMEPYENELNALVSKFNREFNKVADDLKQKYGENSPEVQFHDDARRDLKKKFLEENLPEGYMFWRVSEENRLFWGKTISEKALNKTLDDAKNQVPVMDVIDELINSIGTGLMVGAKRKQYMIPVPLATQLDEMARNEVIHPLSEILQNITGEWKKLMLLSPFRIFRYNLNNFGGDIDRTLQVAPDILKYAKESINELWDFHHYGNISPTLAQAMRGSVVDSGFEISELSALTKQEWATHFLDKSGGPTAQDIFGKQWVKDMAMAASKKPGSMYDKYMEWAGRYARLRENVLRYAAYKLALEKINKGETFYWASRKSSIDAIQDVRQRAAKLAREAYGDYGNISASGKDLRKFAIPFYSWLEINMGTTLRLIKNANTPAVQKALVRSAIMRGIPSIVVRIGLANMKLLLFTAMVQAWNRYMFEMVGGDDDAAEKLRRVNMKGMQILVGMDDKGIVKAIPVAGAFYDFVDFFGIPGAISDVERLMIGKGEGWDVLKGVGSQILNRSSQMVNPFPKAGVELVNKESYFPDINNPIPFDDRYEYFANMLTLKDEYNYFLTDKPKKESYLSRKWNNSLLLREFDPEILAYYEAKHIISDYTGKKNEGAPSPTNETDIAKNKAARYYAMNMRFKNYEAADKNLMDYMILGGKYKDLHAKIKNADPFKDLGKSPKGSEPTSEYKDLKRTIEEPGYEPQTSFVKKLSPDDLLIMRDAWNHYQRLREN